MIKEPPVLVRPLPGRYGQRPRGMKPVFIVLHIQEGVNDLWSYFQTIDADSTLWNPPGDLDPMVRLLQDTDLPWTNGLMTEPLNHANPVIDYWDRQNLESTNSISLTIEHAGFHDKPITPAQLERTAQYVAYWCDRWGIPCDRMHVVGHYEVGEHKQCPGASINIDVVVLRAQAILKEQNMPNIPNPSYFPETDKWVTNDQGFFAYFHQFGRAKGIELFGLPISGARPAEPGEVEDWEGKIIQYFERAIFEYRNGKLTLGRVGAAALDRHIKAAPSAVSQAGEDATPQAGESARGENIQNA